MTIDSRYSPENIPYQENITESGNEDPTDESEDETKKKKFPWWLLLVIAGTYYLSNK
jgi:hypothetical protein